MYHSTNLHRAERAAPGRAAVLTKAAVRAAAMLGLKGKELARVLGLSEAAVSRMRKGNWLLREGSKEYELAALVVRLFRSLDAMVGGDAEAMRAWMRAPNEALEAVPAERISQVEGLVDVLAYLDARRARL